MTPKAQVIKPKSTGNKTKWNYIKLKGFCTAKEPINKMKRQSMEWEKTFANHIIDELIPEINSYNSIAKNAQTTRLRKGGKDLNRHFSKEDIQMANRYMKRCAPSPIIREMHIKTTRCHLTPLRMEIINKNKKYVLAKM